jgi:hypothetical protein
MWEYLRSLPDIFSFSIVVLGLVAIVIISLRGTAVVQWGKNLVGLGGAKIPPRGPANENSENESSENGSSMQAPVPPPTIYFRTMKRSCGDCILFVMSEREKYEIKISGARDKILKHQMNYFEQKTIEIQEVIESLFSEALNSTKTQALLTVHGIASDVEYKFFSELLKDTLHQVKNEMRRSYKDNGYSEMTASDFSNYVRDKGRLIMNIITLHIKSMYPAQGMLINLTDILTGLSYKTPEITEIIRECFEYSKEVTMETDKQIESYKKEFSDWVDKFICET